MKLLALLIGIFYFSLASCEIIEYYPSQSIFNALHNKESLTNQQRQRRFIEKNNKVKIDWRIFDEDHKTCRISNVTKRAVDPVFYGHPKTREELWNEHFLNKSTAFDQTPSLIKLIHNITVTYLNECTPVILYDNQVKSRDSYLFQNLLKGFPVSYVHGYIDDDNRLKEPKLLFGVKECLHFIVFLEDVKVSAKILGKQSESKVVVVARSSQWAVQEFLSSSLSRMFINLLVIGQSFKDDDDEMLVSLI